MKSQRDEIKAMLEEGHIITHRDAELEVGCTRLPARIWELKRQGMKIEKTMIPVQTRRGKTMVAAYRMVE